MESTVALLRAEISNDVRLQDGRSAERRTIWLVASASSPRNSTKVLIHDLSTSGLLIETIAELVVGDKFLVDLPEVGHTEARVVWGRQSYFGCDFQSPIPKHVVSAALLQSTFEQPDPALEELPVGTNPSSADMDSWISEFDKTKRTLGCQLIGFRRTPDGLIIAMVARAN
jgi:hypothetical protein